MNALEQFFILRARRHGSRLFSDNWLWSIDVFSARESCIVIGFNGRSEKCMLRYLCLSHYKEQTPHIYLREIA